VKFLVDVNLSPSRVPFLDSAGLVAVHWSTVGDPRADDRELMDRARSNGCVVVATSFFVYAQNQVFDLGCTIA
jgi:predicted nuclease of predicted toxin-antitoxin system